MYHIITYKYLCVFVCLKPFACQSLPVNFASSACLSSVCVVVLAMFMNLFINEFLLRSVVLLPPWENGIQITPLLLYTTTTITLLFAFLELVKLFIGKFYIFVYSCRRLRKILVSGLRAWVVGSHWYCRGCTELHLLAWAIPIIIFDISLCLQEKFRRFKAAVERVWVGDYETLSVVSSFQFIFISFCGRVCEAVSVFPAPISMCIVPKWFLLMRVAPVGLVIFKVSVTFLK